MIPAAALFVWVQGWFLLSLVKRRNDVADVAWGLGFILVGVTEFLVSSSFSNSRSIIVLALVAIWGVRLATYIGLRSKGAAEDPRYTEMRNSWGDKWMINSYLKVFLLQGLLCYLVALPLMAALRLSEAPLGLIDFAAIALALTGFIVEAIADQQKSSFKSKPENRGKICDVGLWSRSRHPNYFGEICFWLGIGLFSMNEPLRFWWAWLGPVLIILLLWKVSGVPLIEKRYAGRSDYDDYKKRTNLFVPIRFKN